MYLSSRKSALLASRYPSLFSKYMVIAFVGIFAILVFLLYYVIPSIKCFLDLGCTPKHFDDETGLRDFYIGACIKTLKPLGSFASFAKGLLNGTRTVTFQIADMRGLVRMAWEYTIKTPEWWQTWTTMKKAYQYDPAIGFSKKLKEICRDLAAAKKLKPPEMQLQEFEEMLHFCGYN